MTLIVTEPGHERLVAFAATTDAPQPENVSRLFRSGKAEETRQPVHTGDFTLKAKRTDHVLIWPRRLRGRRQAGHRSAGVAPMAERARSSKDGRYRIEGIPSGPLEVHAIAKDSDAAPLDLTIEIPEQPRQIEHDLILPRGLIVTGRVVDGTTGQGVAKASIRFEPKPENSRAPTVFGFMKETDADGRFRIAVPPGSGTVLLQSVPPTYPPLHRPAPGRARRSAGQSRGQGPGRSDGRDRRLPALACTWRRAPRGRPVGPPGAQRTSRNSRDGPLAQ